MSVLSESIETSARSGPGAQVSKRVAATAGPGIDPDIGVIFERYVADVRAGLEQALEDWIGGRIAELARLPHGVQQPAHAVFELVRRGGKRWRAALVACAYDAFDGAGGARAVLGAGVAMEMLQAYLLIHDDWMDHDDVRRGGPSVPAMMRERFGAGERADANAILAGDYAAALAQAALFSVPLPADRVVLAARELARASEEVVLGQLLDVNEDEQWDVEATHSMKTASYSVRGPVLIGARLAGASDAACSALEAFARPLGVAFQLRDDVLGTFGDTAATGKPRFSDLRSGKRTALIVEARKESASVPQLGALGDTSASTEAVAAAARYLETSGARARVEARIDALLAQSCAALEASPLVGARVQVLKSAVSALGHRKH